MRKTIVFHFCWLVFTFTLFAVSAQAQTSNANNLSLIPFKTESLKRMFFSTIFPQSWRDIKVESFLEVGGGIEFTEKNTFLRISSLNGELERWTFTDQDVSPIGVEKMKQKILPIISNPQDYSEIHSKEGIFFFSKKGLPTLHIHVDSKAKKITVENGIRPYNEVFDIIMLSNLYNMQIPKSNTVSLTPSQAKSLAMYHLSTQNPKLDYPIKKMTHKGVTVDRINLILRRDSWLEPKHYWLLHMELGKLFVDASSGEVLDIELSPVWQEEKYSDKYTLSKETIHPEPTFNFVRYKTESEVLEEQEKISSVKFNGLQMSLEGKKRDLHFPPLTHENSVLIYSNYFPSFLITTNREGEKITLQGQLPEKGKKAELTLGSTAAIVDGKPVTLSAAPQEIEGRLYLPYELLSLCNGVLTRYEPHTKTLYVDTRFLRRPDPAEVKPAPLAAPAKSAAPKVVAPKTPGPKVAPPKVAPPKPAPKR